MRAHRLCGLTLAVALAHASGWLAVTGARPLAGAGRPPAARRLSVSLVAASAPTPTPTPATQRTGLGPVPGPRPAGSRRRKPGAGPEASPRASAWPVYATRLPGSTALRYVLDGNAGGQARLDWTHDADAFTLRLALAQPGRAPREWLSTGGFDPAGLAPERLVERDKGRDRRALSIDPATRSVRFSAAPQALALAPGAQDRWSWIAQLAAIAEAAGPRVAPGTTWRLQVAGLRGELDVWAFRVLPRGAPPPPLAGLSCRRACALLHVLREPERPYDLRVEAWLAPGLHHLPAGLRMSTPPGAWTLALWVEDDTDP